MLPRSQRLNLKLDFKWAASGRKIQSNYLKLFVKDGDNIIPRIGIAVSSKIFPKAIQRNRARRLASKAFETLYKDLPKNVNIMALPKSGIISVKLQDVLLDLRELLENEKIINQPN